MLVERLFGIVYYILNHKKATINELAEIFEVSTRTINRDINKLSNAGIPIYTEVGRNGGVYLLNNFILDNVLLSEEEQKAILFAIKGTSGINPKTNEQIFLKLQALFKQSSDNWLQIDLSTWHHSKSMDNKFELIKQSILNKNQLEFIYTSPTEACKKRICNPYRLIFKSQSWYLQAFCLMENAFRYFKLTRMNTITNKNKSFLPIIPPDIPKIKYTSKIIDIQLEFSKDIFYRVYDEFDTNDIIFKDSEKLIVKTEFPDEKWLIRYLLSFGKSLKILSPNTIITRMKEELDLMYFNVLHK